MSELRLQYFLCYLGHSNKNTNTFDLFFSLISKSFSNIECESCPKRHLKYGGEIVKTVYAVSVLADVTSLDVVPS